MLVKKDEKKKEGKKKQKQNSSSFRRSLIKTYKSKIYIFRTTDAATPKSINAQVKNELLDFVIYSL